MLHDLCQLEGSNQCLAEDCRMTFEAWLCLLYSGVILFRPPVLKNKFEESTVAYSEDTFTSSKIKKFIQDNMWVWGSCLCMHFFLFFLPNAEQACFIYILSIDSGSTQPYKWLLQSYPGFKAESYPAQRLQKYSNYNVGLLNIALILCVNQSL